MEKKLSHLGKSLLIEIRPLPMVAALLTAFFGGVLGFLITGVKYSPLLLHVANVAVVLYGAHLVDTYNDLMKRKEYQHGYKRRFLVDWHNPQRLMELNMKHYKYALFVTYPIAIALTGILVVEVGLPYALIALGGIFFSVSYGSGLDRILLAGDFAYGIGVVLAFVGGFYVVTGAFTPEIAVMSLFLIPMLLGAKIIDAEPDIEVDKMSKPLKRTIPVVLGLKWSHRVAYVLMLSPLAILAFMILAMNPTLIYPLLAAIGLILGSYRLPAIKGVYFVFGGIILFLICTIIILMP